ncbi:hypothetical protein B0J18DRAFT_110726 [Chaetomium sp. MPI-SDFR-AT-0129]|nr:hypothetical protein B0J18DRAFT_110726 [Chaetomium sp. MPI-SDFR-AT-0129]
MSDYDKAGVAQSERVSDKPRKRGCLGHCAKFWWAYLLIIIVIVVIVVPVVLLVAVPKIAQSKLDEAELILNRLTVTNTQTQNLTISLSSTIKTDGSVKANIAAFEGVMYLEDRQPHTPFATLNFPATTADAEQHVNVTQFLPVEDLEALTNFNSYLLANETLRVTVEGNTFVQVSGISRAYPVVFKKTVTMPGLKLLEGTIVNPTWVNTTADERGNNFRANTIIPNRSRVSFDLGNVTFHNYLFDKEVGTVYIDNLVLNPGDNHYPMRATMEDLGALLTALGQKPYCEGKGDQKGVLPFGLRGKTDVRNGQPLPYFNDALAAHNQTVQIPIGQALRDHLNIDVPCGGLGGGN